MSADKCNRSWFAQRLSHIYAEIYGGIVLLDYAAARLPLLHTVSLSPPKIPVLARGAGRRGSPSPIRSAAGLHMNCDHERAWLMPYELVAFKSTAWGM